ncbi:MULTISPECIES: LuxR C-terminal-related transcriptional regulator [unclassified Pseudomonas]|uniref:LuxR C-terminal-related transcriptional regulator n=1 Tax=unclassified Pseudomonas TaxID=196821 RepID=UPI000C8789C2|nr:MULTISPECIES: LuxR C-terminal-related transcriptional regulator [unclassified Pseudomonas]PMU12265.1 helix-turn-helix transcriptional regulator [Pseudomonas sp. FW305-20]PMU19730.1 helix-turn-helix transcriptional regulator [Pseudomonas sp. FW305-122]PMU42742.1 helix-turn-helix transcriptional regulator [Pseudomonas sp. FW305-47B]PMX62144.1 helix-turn-helix transcriptional regulator [Pseudomonas sp. FW305-33]PMX69973.1 helix-turn-helix transcriptional regulator [Pseudomonas sp. FW305-60]
MTAMIPCLDRPGFLPRLSTHHLSRSRLTEPLLASTARVKLLCAPAGSGKTALLAECLLQAPPHCRVFWLPLSGVVLSAADFRHRLAETLGLASSDESELLGYLARLQTPTWLFLDDYCRLPDPELDLLLDRMLATSSPMLTWWLGARRRPPCNWPRLLLDDELYECESTSLAFTADEVEQIVQPWVPEQAGKVASRIIQRTGGWCAGVRIALLQKCDWSRQNKPLGRADTLLDYLEHELFNSLTPELSEAWRVLAHLPRFNARLCDHLFGAGEGAQYLRTLQTLGCFIEPWGDSTDWLQIFTPFTQLLRDEQWPAGRSWHRRACQWFCTEQDWKSAFEQALLAEEYEVAVSLLQHFSFEHLFEEQTVVLLLRLHEQQGEELTLGSPQLVGLITAALLFAGRFDQATACIAHLAHFTPQPSAVLERQLIARWQALQGWLLHLQGRMEASRAHFLDALSALDPECWTARLMCLSGLTQQALLRGELDVAQAHNRDALCLARAQGSLVFEGLMELDHAQWLEQRGAPARAESLLLNIHELLCQQADRPAPLLGRIALRRGRLALTMGQDEHARECFQRGLELCLRSHDKRVLYGFLGLAQLAANQGDYTQAFVQLRDAERLMQQRKIPDTVYRGVLLQVSSQFWLQQGRPQLAHEALARVLRHYCGPQARQAPPATLELIPRIEYLLILAEVYLQQLSNAEALLQTLIDNAHANGMYALEAELHLARAEVIWLEGESHLATAALQEGEQMISRCQGRQAWRELQLRQPQWLRTAEMSITELSVEAHSSSPLSKRELEVLQLIAQGNSNQQIADVLFISLHTVKTHARRINGKLGVERRTQAVAKAKLLGVCS